jgi:hypothetical protein
MGFARHSIRALDFLLRQMRTTKHKLRLSLLILLVLAAHNALAQKNPDEPQIVTGDSGSCELNALFLDNLGSMARSGSERIFIIARQGHDEQSSLISRRRLLSVREQLVQNRGISAERITFAEGDRINGDGRVEYYFGSKLVFVSLARRNRGLCLSCCDDPPPKSFTRKKRRRNSNGRRRPTTHWTRAESADLSC